MERPLEAAHAPAGGKGLDRLDAAAGDARGERDAGEARLAVDEHRARAAFTPVAPLFRAGEADGAAQVVDEERVIGDRVLALATVDGDLQQPLRHIMFPSDADRARARPCPAIAGSRPGCACTRRR